MMTGVVRHVRDQVKESMWLLSRSLAHAAGTRCHLRYLVSMSRNQGTVPHPAASKGPKLSVQQRPQGPRDANGHVIGLPAAALPMRPQSWTAGRLRPGRGTVIGIWNIPRGMAAEGFVPRPWTSGKWWSI